MPRRGPAYGSLPGLGGELLRFVGGIVLTFAALAFVATLAGCGVLAAGGAAPASDDAQPSVTASAPGAASPPASAAGATTAPGITYDGRDGVTALELLTDNDPSAEVRGTGDQAFVVGIGGRWADEAKHEFWALYVNGAQATVGAGSLVTKDGDKIEWKLETY